MLYFWKLKVSKKHLCLKTLCSNCCAVLSIFFILITCILFCTIRSRVQCAGCASHAPAERWNAGIRHAEGLAERNGTVTRSSLAFVQLATFSSCLFSAFSLEHYSSPGPQKLCARIPRSPVTSVHVWVLGVFVGRRAEQATPELHLVGRTSGKTFHVWRTKFALAIQISASVATRFSRYMNSQELYSPKTLDVLLPLHALQILRASRFKSFRDVNFLCLHTCTEIQAH